MASLKNENKNRLKLLSLDSIIDEPLKELMKHLIADKTFILQESATEAAADGKDENEILETSPNENKALAELFTTGKRYLKDLFILTYPDIQNLVFADASTELKEIREEIQVKKLDTTAVCNILLKFYLMPTYIEKNHKMKNVLEDILYVRMVTVNHVADLFWTNLSNGSIRLKKYPNFKSWDEFWNHTKGNTLKLLSFLRDEGICAENQFKKWLGEIKLISTWSKQEMLQNYSTQIANQLKTLQYLNNVEKPNSQQKQVDVNIKMSGNLTESVKQEEDWISSFSSYIKSFIWHRSPQISFLKSYGLDGIHAGRIERKLKSDIQEIFGEHAFLSCTMKSVTVNTKSLESSNGNFIPLTILVYTDESVGTSARNFIDPYSETASSLWLTIKQEMSNCIDDKMDIYVDIIRTSWMDSGKINACLFKKTKLPWGYHEYSLVIDALRKWDYPIQMSVHSNPDATEPNAVFTFKLSTVNRRYFDLLEVFADHVNNDSNNEKAIYIEKDDDSIEIFHGNAVAMFKNKAELIASCINISTKPTEPSSREIIEENQLPVINENNQQASVPKRRKSSGTYGYSPQTTPRRTGNTPRNTGNTPRSASPTTIHPSISREGSFAKDNTKHGMSPRESSAAKKKGIPSSRKSFEKKSDPTTLLEIVSQPLMELQTRDERNIPDNGWIKLIITMEYILKPALLQILHNTKKDASIKRLPSDRKELYKCVAAVKKQKAKSFERWNKQELKILLPDCKEVNSNLLTIDMICFLLRFADVIPPPKHGWSNPTPPSLKEKTLAYYCLEAINIHKDVSMVTSSNTNIKELTVLMERVEATLKGFQYDSPLIDKLKKEPLGALFHRNITFKQK